MSTHKHIHRTLLVVLTVSFLLFACLPQPAQVPPTSAPVATSIPEKETLRIWNPNPPTILNPYFSLATQNYEPARIVYEPLADFDKNGDLIPVLAAEIPSRENGLLDKNNNYVIWNLLKNVRWSDGEPFTAHDVVFTYSFITDPNVKVVSRSEYEQIAAVEAVDDYTVKVTFKAPTPAWNLPFVGIRGLILPKHAFEAYKGENALEAPANNFPIGTGPYRVKQPDPNAAEVEQSAIRPQEVLLLGSQVVKTTKIIFEPNPYFRSPEKLAFKQIVYRGGGYLKEYSKQLFTTGDLHVAYQVDSSLMTEQSLGRELSTFLTGSRRLLINFTDPNTPSASGELSSLEVPHPLFKDLRMRQAIAYAIDRQRLSDEIYKGSVPAFAILVAPARYKSEDMFYSYDSAKANALLDEAGYLDTNNDGFREANGVKIKLRFQSFVSGQTQAAQEVIAENLRAIGVDVEIKTTESGILFGDGATNPDSATRFNADLMMFRTTNNNFDPTSFMTFWTCDQIPQAANDWKAGNNNERWCNPAYESLLEKTKTELNVETRDAMFIELNNLMVQDVAMIPLVWETDVKGISKRLKGVDPTPWDALTWNVQDWYLEQP